MSIGRLILTAFMSLSLATAAAAQQQQESKPEEPPTFAVEAQMVLVDVRVMRDGAPVPGLRPGQFRVFEDGVEYEVAQLQEVWTPGSRRPRTGTPYVVLPRSLFLILDEVHLTMDQAETVKRAMVEFLESGTRDGDQVAIISVAEGRWARATVPDGMASLSAFLRELRGRYTHDRFFEDMSEAEAVRIVQGDRTTLDTVADRIYREQRVGSYGQRGGGAREENWRTKSRRDARRLATQLFGQVEQRVRGTLSVLSEALDWSAQSRGSKSFVLASAGFVHAPRWLDFTLINRAAHRANGVVYFLDARQLATPERAAAEQGELTPTSGLLNAEFDRISAAAGAEVMAVESGGFVVRETNNLAAGLNRIGDDSNAYYLLGYEPPEREVRKDELRKIEVRVDAPAVKVRHRKGY